MPRSSTVIKPCTLFAVLLISTVACAEPIGKVSDATGLLLARSAGGTIKVLTVGSGVEPGETLFTRENTYVRVSLTDQSILALGPDTELSVETYSFHQASEEPTDSATLKLSQGRVRISSGVLGTRDPESFKLTAGPTTIDIGHSTFIASYIPDSRAIAFNAGYAPGRFKNVSLRLAQIPAPSIGAQNPGLYVQVLDGMINVSNGGGTQNFTAGQFGYTPGFTQPPVILPNNPGMQFTPPPSFSSTTGGTQNGNSGGKPGDVDCIVR